MTMQRLAILPLPEVVLFPGLMLSLHIFEPRYRAMVREVMARNHKIGVIQSRHKTGQGEDKAMALYDVGCLGRIVEIKLLDDDKYDLILKGIGRFRVHRELDVTTAYRQVEAELEEESEDEEEGQAMHQLSPSARKKLERTAQQFANAHGYDIDWSSVAQLDDRSFVNGVAQIAPFDPAAKQALLESDSLSARADMIIKLIQFFQRHDGDDSPIWQ